MPNKDKDLTGYVKYFTVLLVFRTFLRNCLGILEFLSELISVILLYHLQLQIILKHSLLIRAEKELSTTLCGLLHLKCQMHNKLCQNSSLGEYINGCVITLD